MNRKLVQITEETKLQFGIILTFENVIYEKSTTNFYF